ncbi:MAG: carboxyl transferase domain-containing protein, partial [Oscillospiraceae bacterium]
MYARRLVKDQDSNKSLDETIDKMNKLIKEYNDNSRPEFCAKIGLVDEVVDFTSMRKYIGAFVGASYQNPKSFCAFHQMMTPRII